MASPTASSLGAFQIQPTPSRQQYLSPAAVRRDSLELDIDIEEGKVEVLAKRRRKTSNLDLST
ncbi:hypothetical protein IFR05_017556, partial [Cadophora sp. M221]